MSTEFYNRNWRMPRNANSNKVSNYSMSFDGSSEFIDLGTDIGTFFGEDYTGEMAISIWFKANITSGDDGIFQFTGSTSLGEISAAIYANDLEFRIKGATEISESFTDTSNWHNLIVNLFGSSGANQLYLDGVAFGSTFTYSSGGLDLNGETFNIGHYGNSRYFSGKLDHCCIFDYALSVQQISDLQGSSSTGVGNPMSLSPKPKAFYPIGDYAAFNGSEYLVPNLADENIYSRYALNFDGVSDYATSDSVPAQLNTVSLSIWVKRDGSQLTAAGVFGVRNTGVSSGNFGVCWDLALYSNKITWRIGDTGYNTVQQSTALTDNTWTHVVGVADGLNMFLYINGVKETNTNTYTTPIETPTNKIFIGAQGDAPTDFEFKGSLSNASVFNTGLSQAQVTELYNSGKPSNLNSFSAYSNLVTWYQLGENMSFDSNVWSILDEKGTNNATGQNLGPAEDAIVNGVGTSGNGLSDGMGGADNIVGDAPQNSTANAVSYGMGVDAKSIDVPS